MTRKMREMVQIQGNFKSSVRLPDDFLDEELNRYFVESYIPTQETLDNFLDIRDSLQPNSERRARLFSGTFGTGKSDLMLMIANYITRSPEDSLLLPFFKRLHLLNDAKAEAIYQARLNTPPFLLVLLQADTAITFSSFVLDGLARSLEKACLSHLLGDTYYKAALDLIESWERDKPYNVERLSEALESNYGRTLNQLKHDLSGPQADTALEMFRPAAFQAIGMPFHPTAVIQRPSDAFTVVSKNLPSNQYSGIFVIADEFTHLLQKLADSPTAADSKAIDNLAEAAVRSRQNQLHFYTVSLESFASAQGSTKLAQIALERSGGRFTTYELRSQNMEELISASIAKLVPATSLFEGIHGQLDDLLTLATNLWSGRATGRKDREWLNETIVRGCFPLHPLTTYCLPRLNAVLAQNERTMFSFIWDRSRGLGHFIEEASGEVSANGWLPLLSLDKLFSYFEPNVKEKRPELLFAYQQASSSLSSTQLEDGLEGRLLRALVILETAGGDSSLRADQELLRHALGLAPSQKSDVTAALEQLEQNGIAYPSQNGHYQLVKSGRANPLELRRLVQQRSQELTGSLIELLNARYKPHDVEAEHYNSERGTSRQLMARFANLAELSSPASLTQALQDSDALLWYVIAASEQDLEHARSAALQLTRLHDQLVVAVPRKPTDLVVRFQRLRALEELRTNSNFATSDYQVLFADSGLVGKDYTTAFQEALQLFGQPSKFEWFYSGRTVTVTTPAHLSAWATTVMNEVFSATPMHKTRQHLKPTGKSKHLRDALNQIVQEEIQLVEGSRSAVDAILMNGAYELGLINYSEKRKGFKIYNVCLPDRSQRYSYEVWLHLYELLKDETPWPIVIEKLLNRPYGLYSSVLQLFVAAFYRLNRDYLEIYPVAGANSHPIDVTGDTIIDMVEAPNKYIVRYQPLTDLQCKFLRGFVDRALYPRQEFQIQRGETASLRNRAAKLLRRWIASIPGIPLQTSIDELASVLQDVPLEVLRVCAVLIEIAFQTNEATIAAALLDSLPTQLGLAADSSSWTDIELDQAIAYLESACRQMQRFSKVFETYMTWQIGQQFGLSEPTKDVNNILKVAQKWRKETVGIVSTIHLAGTPDARDLLHFLEDKPHSFEQVFLNALAFRWVKRPFQEWQEIGIRDEYLQRLTRAKSAVETKAAELRSVSPEKKPIEPIDVKPLGVQSTSTKSASITTSLPESKPLTTIKPATVNPAPKTLDESRSANRLPFVAERHVTELISQNDTDVVAQAFAEIKVIFECLSQQNQYTLWKRLVEEYDPR